MPERARVNGRKTASIADHFAPPESFPIEAARWVLALNHESSPTVLELGVGTGRILSRIAEALESTGMLHQASVHGIDASTEMLAKAREKKLLANATFEVGDIRDTRLQEDFSIVLCLGNTLGYTTESGTLAAIFETAAFHLKPGGLFLVDFQDMQTLETIFSQQDIVPHFQQTPGGAAGMVQFFSRPAESLLRIDQHYIEGTAVTSFTEELTLYSADQVRQVAHDAGFSSAGEFGDYLGSPLVAGESFLNVFAFIWEGMPADFEEGG